MSGNGADYRQILFQLLPDLYRGSDKDGKLEAFLAIFGHELVRLRGNMDQLLDDLFIDSCQDWVVPYIGDLVGTRILFNDAARNRADVLNTIKWRRRKGTVDGLEDVAAVITDWGARAVEMFEHLIWSQNLEHLRPHALHTVDLGEPSSLARVGTPFELACRSYDLRQPGQAQGWHRLDVVNFFLWAIGCHRWRGVDPVAEDTLCWRFDPLGRDIWLHAGGRQRQCSPTGHPAPTRPDICWPRTDDVPIRGQDFDDNPERYFGQPAGFSLYEDGILLCRTANTAPSTSTTPSNSFARLATSAGIKIADTSLFGGSGSFRIEAVRLRATGAISPMVPFVSSYEVAGAHGRITTDTLAYTQGLPFDPSPPASHQRALLLRVERTGSDPNFPECELILRSAKGLCLLVFLPGLTGLALNDPLYLYVADDGGTYFARADHAAGAPDRNPDSGLYGAFLPARLARQSEGQVMPRPGLRPVAHRVPVHRRLCCWDQPLTEPLQPDEVAMDPERGRIMFPAGEAPAGELTADFRFAITARIGAGPFARSSLPAATHTVAKVVDGPVASLHFRSIQDAINAAPDGSSDPVVIEILDSSTYEEALQINGRSFPGGLVIQASSLQAPVITTTAATLVQVTATSSVAHLTFSGLALAGGDVTVAGDVEELLLTSCSLEPATTTLAYSPVTAGSTLKLDHCICGVVSAAATVGLVEVLDTIMHHPAAQPDDTIGRVALTATHEVELERVTLLGELVAGILTASNSILVGDLSIGDPDAGCLRYSRHPKGATVPRSFRTTHRFPIFCSTRFGHPGYMHLHPNTAPAIRNGGEEGGEMGAFYEAGIPWREQNLAIKLEEYTPAGLYANPVRVLLNPGFPGVRRQ